MGAASPERATAGSNPDNIVAVVIDNGSGMCTAGFSTGNYHDDCIPTTVFPTVVGHHKFIPVRFVTSFIAPRPSISAGWKK